MAPASHVHMSGFIASSPVLEAMVRDANDAITLQDLTGNIVAWNRGAERMYGYSEAEARAMNIASITMDGDAETLDYLRVIQGGGEAGARQVRRRTKDGRIVDVWLTTTRITVDDTVLVATAERDVTAWHRLEQDLRFELAAMTKLHGINALYLDNHSLNEILDKILEVAIEVSEASFGNIQILDPAASALKIIQQRGLPASWSEYWDRAARDRGACDLALERRERVIVDDVERSPIFVGTEALAVQRAASVRAVQSTPLFDRRGGAVGVLSTHYRVARRPPGRALHMLDLLAAQAAQVIGRLRDDAALRQSYELVAQHEAMAKLTVERLHSAVDSMDDAFALFDHQDRLVLCNHAFRRLVHTPALVGTSFADILDAWLDDIDFPDPAARARYREHRLALRTHGETVTFDLRMRDGRSFRVTDRRTPEGGMMKTIVDRTEDERRVAEQRQAHAASESASAAKTEFLSAMSHELRTPLNAILGFAELLVRDQRDPLHGRHHERVEHILTGGNHLLHLINDVLDLSRIEAGQISMSTGPVNVAEVLEEVRRTLAPLAARQDLTLELEDLPAALPMILADRTRFTQILMNFGSNAIKYNRPSGRVRFEVSVVSAGRVRVVVADTGIGIPVNKQDKLFQPFQRAGQEIGPIEGTGIGLVITKRLAELMGGSVGFHSVPGQGSAFWIEIPAPQAAEPAPQPPAPHAWGAPIRLDDAPHLVLYVEDNHANVLFMRDLLSTFENLEVVTAPTAELGLERARARVPALVIMDINLPGMSGLEALRALRARPETQEVPVIALTAAAFERDRQRGNEEGFFRYLAKPIRLDELIDAISAALTPW